MMARNDARGAESGSIMRALISQATKPREGLLGGRRPVEVRHAESTGR